MLRLPHRIISKQGFGVAIPSDMRPDDPYIKELQDRGNDIQAKLLTGNVPIIVADNIGDYYERHKRDEYGPEAFPNIAPPFPRFMVTYLSPEKNITTRGPVVGRRVEQAWFFEVAGQNVNGLLAFGDGGVENDVRWMVTGTNFIDNHGDAMLTGNTTVLFIGSTGQALGWGNVPSRAIRAGDPDYDASCIPIVTALLAIGFMQCKNVIQTDVTAAEGPPPKWCRRQRVPQLSYKMLNIDPGQSRKARAPGVPDGTDRSGKSLHICRGHFAVYTADNPLFGRYTGTYWRPAHTRGDDKHGVVRKDYSVSAPAENSV